MRKGFVNLYSGQCILKHEIIPMLSLNIFPFVLATIRTSKFASSRPIAEAIMHSIISFSFYATLAAASFRHHKTFTYYKLPQSPQSQLASIFKSFIPGGPAPVSSHYAHESIITLDDNSTANYTIELPYANHTPTFIGKSLGLVIYKNIRYAQTPTGPLRFSKPIAPLEVTEDKPTYDGKTQGHSCYQAVPQWVINTQKLANPDFDWEEWLDTSTDGEDCLFLDVVKPLNVTEEEMGTLPVLVWIYGGGYAFGAKENPIYKPDGLKTRAGDNKFVWVTLNYRVSILPYYTHSLITAILI